MQQQARAQGSKLAVNRKVAGTKCLCKVLNFQNVVRNREHTFLLSASFKLVALKIIKHAKHLK